MFRLGIIIGSSSVEESSSSEDAQLFPFPLLRFSFRLRTAVGVVSSSSTTIVVVSARARPLESIVNLTEVCVLGGVSGMELKLGSRCW